MNPPTVERDERFVMVENSSYRWACSVMSFGLLLDAVYRSFVRHESAFDLLGLVILGGAVASAYQYSQRVLYRRWAVAAFVTVAAAAVVAIVIALLRGAR